VRSILRGPALSLGSQLIGLIQLALLLWRAGANESTDAYFYLFNIGMLPIQVLIVGVMYPLLLNNERITRRGIRRVRQGAPVISLLLMVGGAAYLYLNDRLSSALWPMAIAALINAFVQAHLWFRGVTAEAGGNPRWNAAIALPANALAAISLLIPFDSPTTSVTVMVLALVLGNVALLAIAAKMRLGDDVVESAPESSPRRTGAYWFLTKASVGYIGLVVLQSLAVQLPPSAVTLLNIGVKIVGSTASTFVNAVMPRIIHHRTDSMEPSRRFLRWLVAILGGMSIFVIGLTWALYPALLVTAICVGLWVIASSSSAIAQRMSFRFLRPNASRVTLIAVPAVVLLALASSSSPGFQLVVILCAYAAVDGATATLLLFALRDRLMSWILLGTCLALATLWTIALL
jgi:hypothetical protein